MFYNIASDCLGNSAVALTAVSPSLASQEKDDIEKLVQDIGIRHHFLTSHETEDPRYKVNDTNRCYFCKTNVYNDLVNYAEAEGYKVLLDGTMKLSCGKLLTVSNPQIISW